MILRGQEICMLIKSPWRERRGELEDEEGR